MKSITISHINNTIKIAWMFVFLKNKDIKNNTIKNSFILKRMIEMEYSPLIIITNRNCNNLCDHCSIENRESKINDEISLLEFSQIVHDFKFINEIYLFGGEPTITKNFLKYLDIINIGNICPGIITNGRLFEKKPLSDAFWIQLKKINIKKINISVSIDYFHKKFYLLRNNDNEYPSSMLYNIGDSSKYGIEVNLTINWVYSNIKDHSPTANDYNTIINILSKLKKERKIKSYKFILDPLQKKIGTNIDNIYKRCQINPYILAEPAKNPKKFNFCSPYFCAKKKNNKIQYYFCMYMGDKSHFSSVGRETEKDLKDFLQKHRKLESIVKTKKNINTLLTKQENDESFKKFLNSKQECFKENRACGICNYLFSNNVL